MLPQAAFLFNTSGGSGLGLYQVDVNFSNASKAQFLAPGDRITDKDGNTYLVDSPSGWVGYPTDFSNNGTVHVVPVSSDISPINSLALGDATVETPGQFDVDPQVQTAGTISSSALIEGRTYTYQVSAGWLIGSEANKAAVGDRIIDNAGKVFEIVALSGQPGAFSSPFNVVEADKVGDAPNAGNAYLYRGTPNFDFYQGEFLAQLPEDAVRNRDEYITDLNLLSSVVTARGISSASGVVTVADNVIVVTHSGAVTLTLQGAFTDGKLIYVKDGYDAGTDRLANPITIQGGGTTIDGVASVQMFNPGESYTLAHNSGVWHLV
jgi:hypothetical protein